MGQIDEKIDNFLKENEELKTTNQELYKAFIEFFNDKNVKEYLDEYELFDDTEVEISKFYDGSYKIDVGHSDAGMNTFFEDLIDVESWYDSENIEYPLGNGFGYFADFNIDFEKDFIDKEDVYELINQTDFKENSNSLSLGNWSIATYEDNESYYCGLVYENQLDYTSLFKIEAEEFNNFNNNIHNKEIFNYLYHLLGIDDYLIEVEKEENSLIEVEKELLNDFKIVNQTNQELDQHQEFTYTKGSLKDQLSQEAEQSQPKKEKDFNYENEDLKSQMANDKQIKQSNSNTQ